MVRKKVVKKKCVREALVVLCLLGLERQIISPLCALSSGPFDPLVYKSRPGVHVSAHESLHPPARRYGCHTAVINSGKPPPQTAGKRTITSENTWRYQKT